MSDQPSKRRSKNPSRKAALLGASLFAATLAGLAQQAAALTITETGGRTIDFWDVEPGQSIPTGTVGYVNGQIAGDLFTTYVFTYGPDFLLPGATGYGDATKANSFWVDSVEVFCNPSAAALGRCGGVASTPGDSVTLVAAPGYLPFRFQFDNQTIDNGENFSAYGATLITAVDILPDATLGATPQLRGFQALVGLSDGPYPGADHDFQDLTVLITEVPEPASLALLATGVMGLVVGRRRRATPAAA